MKKFPTIYTIRSFITMLRMPVTGLYSKLFEPNLHTPTLFVRSILILFLMYAKVFDAVSSFHVFWVKFCMTFSSHMQYMIHSFQPWFLTNLIIFSEGHKLLKLFVLQFSNLLFCYFFVLRWKYSLQHSVLKHSQSFFA
jgi:hypothetical protein